MFNFATITVYFRFTDIVFRPICCENNEICLLVYNESLLVLNQVEYLCGCIYAVEYLLPE